MAIISTGNNPYTTGSSDYDDINLAVGAGPSDNEVIVVFEDTADSADVLASLDRAALFVVQFFQNLA